MRISDWSSDVCSSDLIAEDRQAGDVTAIAAGDQRFPFARRRDAGGGDAEIGVGVVGADVERALALVDVIFAPLLPRRDEQRRRFGIVGGDQIDIARLVIYGRCGAQNIGSEQCKESLSLSVMNQ